MKKEEVRLNKFDQLVEDLAKGRLSWKSVQMALRAANEQGKFALEIKDIESQFIYDVFKLMSNTLGKMELIYRRAFQAGGQEFEETEFGKGVKDLWEEKELGEVELAKSFRLLWEKEEKKEEEED